VWAQPKPAGGPRTGDYEDAVHLGYDSVTKEVSGYIKMEVQREDQPKKTYRSCSVLFIGKMDGAGKAKVEYYNTPDLQDVTAGEAEFGKGGISLTARSGEGYCNDILGLTVGVDMNFSKARPYIGCRGVSKPKTYIYSAAVDSSRTKMYLVKGDLVMVLGVAGEFVNIEYLGKRVITGWVKKEEVFPRFR
jgi:hypothetical protein